MKKEFLSRRSFVSKASMGVLGIFGASLASKSNLLITPLLAETTSNGEHCKIVFSPIAKNRGAFDLYLIYDDKVKLSVKVNNLHLIYGVGGDYLVVIYGDKNGEEQGYTIKLIDIKNGKDVNTSFISGLHIYTYLDGPHKTVHFDPIQKKIYFLGIDLKNIPENGVLVSTLFCFSIDKKEWSVSNTLNGQFHYALPLTKDFVGVHGTNGKLTIFDMGDGAVKETFEVDFKEEEEVEKIDLFFEENAVIKFKFSPDIGLCAWNKNGRFAYIGSSSFERENSPKKISAKNEIVSLCPLIYKEKKSVVYGFSKENSTFVDGICVFDIENQKEVLIINFEEPCCSMAYNKNSHAINLIGTKTSRVFHYDLNTDKFSKGIEIKVFAGEYPFLLEA